jgi:hypothetical protein
MKATANVNSFLFCRWFDRAGQTRNQSLPMATSPSARQHANRPLSWLTVNAVGLALLVGISNFSIAQAAGPEQTAHAPGREMMMPQSAQEHLARADLYEKKAIDVRSDIKAHQKMLADYTKTVAVNAKASTENAYIKNMRLHCESYISAAEALAHEDDEMAKLHTLRAKEAQGK